MHVLKKVQYSLSVIFLLQRIWLFMCAQIIGPPKFSLNCISSENCHFWYTKTICVHATPFKLAKTMKQLLSLCS